MICVQECTFSYAERTGANQCFVIYYWFDSTVEGFGYIIKRNRSVNLLLRVRFNGNIILFVRHTNIWNLNVFRIFFFLLSSVNIWFMKLIKAKIRVYNIIKKICIFFYSNKAGSNVIFRFFFLRIARRRSPMVALILNPVLNTLQWCIVWLIVLFIDYKYNLILYKIQNLNTTLERF